MHMIVSSYMYALIISNATITLYTLHQKLRLHIRNKQDDKIDNCKILSNSRFRPSLILQKLRVSLIATGDF